MVESLPIEPHSLHIPTRWNWDSIMEILSNWQRKTTNTSDVQTVSASIGTDLHRNTLRLSAIRRLGEQCSLVF